jgi:hypothetical protein
MLATVLLELGVKVKLNRLKMLISFRAIWCLLSLSFFTSAGSFEIEAAHYQESKVPAIRLDSPSGLILGTSQIPNRSGNRIFDRSFLNPSVFVGPRVHYLVSHSAPELFRIRLFDQSFPQQSISIRPRVQYLGSRLASKLFGIWFFDQISPQPTVAINPRNQSLFVRTHECFEKGLSLGGCGE